MRKKEAMLEEGGHGDEKAGMSEKVRIIACKCSGSRREG